METFCDICCEDIKNKDIKKLVCNHELCLLCYDKLNDVVCPFCRHPIDDEKKQQKITKLREEEMQNEFNNFSETILSTELDIARRFSISILIGSFGSIFDRIQLNPFALPLRTSNPYSLYGPNVDFDRDSNNDSNSEDDDDDEDDDNDDILPFVQPIGRSISNHSLLSFGLNLVDEWPRDCDFASIVRFMPPVHYRRFTSFAYESPIITTGPQNGLFALEDVFVLSQPSSLELSRPSSLELSQSSSLELSQPPSFEKKKDDQKPIALRLEKKYNPMQFKINIKKKSYVQGKMNYRYTPNKPMKFKNNRR